MSNRTNITVLNGELWKWAKKKAIDLEFNGVSEYIFKLLNQEKEREEYKEINRKK